MVSTHPLGIALFALVYTHTTASTVRPSNLFQPHYLGLAPLKFKNSRFQAHRPKRLTQSPIFRRLGSVYHRSSFTSKYLRKRSYHHENWFLFVTGRPSTSIFFGCTGFLAVQWFSRLKDADCGFLSRCYSNGVPRLQFGFSPYSRRHYSNVRPM
jgi:hypothetical protein